jgi:hypothetical protein
VPLQLQLSYLPYDGPVPPTFEVTFDRAGKGWAASVAQTAGLVVLPPETPVFTGKSLASVEERVSAYLAALELTDWSSFYNFAPALTPELEQLLGAAFGAKEELEAAEYRKVRHSHRAIEALTASGFTMRDISVLLGESRTAVQQIQTLGKTLRDTEDEDA